jgi:DNA-binding MarR family transcriptional regulator
MTLSSQGPGQLDAWGILAHLWQLIQTVLDDSAPALEAIGLTPKMFFLLSAVEEHPFPAELARLMHLPPPTVTYMVKQMESKGFLGRRTEPGDLRKFRLILTDDGRRAMAQAHEAIGQVMSARLVRLAPEEVGSFDRLVERLARPGP